MNSIYLLLDRLWQWISERVFIRFEFEMPDLKDHFDKATVCFTMTSGGLVEWLILSSWCRREGFAPILITNRKRLLLLGKPPIGLSVFLRKRSWESIFLGLDTAGARLIFSRPDERRQLLRPSRVESLLAKMQRSQSLERNARPVVVVPVLVTWRKYQRGAARNPSEFFFGLSSRPNLLGKIWYLLRRRKDSTVKGLAPFLMSECKSSNAVNILNEDEPMRVAKIARRRAIIAIKEEMRILLGPRYVSPTAVKESIIHDGDVQATIDELGREERIDRRKMMLGAYRMLTEIVADYSYRFIEVIYVFLTWLFTRVFDGLDYRDEEVAKLRETIKHRPVIFVSAHRSHLDYLVIPYLLFLNNIVTPHIAAGVNLSFWPVGGLLRKCGAFFLRRSFRGERLYSLLLKKYVWFLMQNRFNILFFIEGTRSRTGKMLPPTYGILKMIVTGFQEKRYDDISLIPVSLSYDQVLEEGTYAKELAGANKEKEGARALFRSRSVVSRNIGKVYVRLGTPLTIKESFTAAGAGQVDERLHLQKTAFELCTRINSVTPVMPKAILATVLLAQSKPETLEAIGAKGDGLFRFATEMGFPTTIGDRDVFHRAVESILRQFHRNNLVAASEGSMPLAFEIDRSKRGALVLYRNNAIHCFVTASIAYLSLLMTRESGDSHRGNGVSAHALRIRNYFKFDFFFSNSSEFRSEIDRIMFHLTGADNWAENTCESIEKLLRGSTYSWKFVEVVRSVLGDLAESYAIAIDFVASHGEMKLERKALLQRMLKESQGLLANERLGYPEAASVQNFGSALQMLENYGAIRTVYEGEKPLLVIETWRSEWEELSRLSKDLVRLTSL